MKPENGHSVPLTNGVWVVANGKPCDVTSSEKSELKDTVTPAAVNAEKFNSKKAFEEYFIPANTHKKFLRGEKLYLSNESESAMCRCCSWKRALVVVLVVVLLAGAGLLGALAATGFFSSQNDTELRPAPSDQPSHSAHTSLPPVSQPRGGLPRPQRPSTPAFAHPSTTREVPKRTTAPSGRRPDVGDVLPLTSAVTRVPDTSYSVPKEQASVLSGKIVVLNRNFTEALGDRRTKQFQELASDLEKKLENVYSQLKSFSHAKVLSFQPSNSIVVKFVLTWNTEGIPEIDATHLLYSHLNRNGGFLGPYLLDPLAIKIRKESSNPNATDIGFETTTLISSPANEDSILSSNTSQEITSTKVTPTTTTAMNTTYNENVTTIETSSEFIPTDNNPLIRPLQNTTNELVETTLTETTSTDNSEQIATTSPYNDSTTTLQPYADPTTTTNIPTSIVDDESTTFSDYVNSTGVNDPVMLNTSSESNETSTSDEMTLPSEDVPLANTTDDVTANTTNERIENNSTADEVNATETQLVTEFTTETNSTETISENIPPQDVIYTVEPRSSESLDNLTETTSEDVVSPVTALLPVTGLEYNESTVDLLNDNSTQFTTSSYNTTHRSIRMETEQPDIVLPVLIQNVTDETTITTLSSIQAYTTTNESELSTHGTSILFTDSVATPETFAMTVLNDTEDSTQQTEDSNTTLDFKNITEIPTPTLSNNSNEYTNVTSELDEPGENATDFTTTERITMSVTETMTDMNISNTEYKNNTNFNISENESTESASTEISNNATSELVAEDDTKGIPESLTNVTNFDYDFNVTESNDGNFTEDEMALDESLTTLDGYLNENDTEDSYSTIDATTTDSSTLDGNSTMITTLNSNGTTIAMENETYVDEDTLQPFNESSDIEMYHHTPDSDNATVTEGCPEGTFLCPGGTECLSTDKMCNGMFDCADQSDESNCDLDCGENFRCANTSKCIMMSLRCDGMVDCDDSSDEEDCAPTGCAQHEVMCLDRSVCIKPLEICDGRYNCHDKSDERDCVDRSACQAAGQFYCDDGLCLPPGLQCDGAADCRKGEDEKDCACPEKHFECADGKCIEDIYRCDGHRNCSDGSDEMECLRVDEKGAVQVLNAVTKSWNLLCINDDMPWEEEDGHKLCQELGFSSATSVGQMAVILSGSIFETEGWTQKNMSLAINATYWTAGMTHTNTCDSGLVATLSCTRYECGQLLTADGQTQTLEQWPFLASIIADGPAAANGNVVSPAAEDTQNNGNSLATQSNKIFINNNKSCRAEILSPLWLVTAAGCIQNLPKVNLSVHIDQIDLITSDLNPTAHQHRQVSHIAMHPHLSRFRSHVLNDYDLALVRLDQPLNFSKMAAVCLPDAEVNPGITCFTGSLSSHQARQQRQQLASAQQVPQEPVQPPPEQSEPAAGSETNGEVTRSASNSGSSARFLPFMVQNRSSCNMDIHYKGWVGSRMFCTGNSDEPCHDEAAPLMCLSIYRQWYLAGILSYHRFCGIYKKHPSVYANVFPMRGYIEKVIGMRQYNVTYDANIYELAPPDFTTAPTTTNVPLVDFVPSFVNGSQSESFIQNNQSMENVTFNDMNDLNETNEDGNFTDATNETYTSSDGIYEELLNETYIAPMLYASKEDGTVDFELNNITSNVTSEVGLGTNTEPEVIYERGNMTLNLTTNETLSSNDEWNEDFNLTNAEFLKDYYDFVSVGNYSDQGEIGNMTDGNDLEDIDLCNRTDVASFQCLSGDGCVPLSSLCDGNYNCDDQSDEWQCLRLDDHSGVLEVRGVIPGNSTTQHADYWTAVCADDWQGFLSHRICHQLGYKSSLVTSHVPVQEWKQGSVETGFLAFTNPTAKLVQGTLGRIGNSSCDSGHLISIHCSELQCSLWSAAGDEDLAIESQPQQTTEWGRSLGSNSGGSLAQDGQWPSLIVLRHRGQGRREPCTANVLSQKWLLTASSCLLHDRYESSINESQWEAVSNSCPSQSSPCSGISLRHQVDKVVAHPDARAGPCTYDNDLALVRLSTPLPFGRFTNAVCLPQEPLKPQREVCFLASFYADEIMTVYQESDNVTSILNETNAVPSVRSSLQYLPVPSMQWCSDSDNGTKNSALLCSQVNLQQNEDVAVEGGGASLMCINENHQWELHGLATPALTTNSSEDCKHSPRGTFTSLFAYSQWIAETMRLQ